MAVPCSAVHETVVPCSAVLEAAVPCSAVLGVAVYIAVTQLLAVLHGPVGLLLVVASWAAGLVLAVASWAAGMMADFSAVLLFPDLLTFLCPFPTLEGVSADSTLPPVPLGEALVAGVFPLSRRAWATF
ncbi:hypothetical protein NDU88_005147 [Pleurodeles waltl]|uniref:Uncharacterized protein n=1 Tax=Pleurodeles waltl TaxID=8319 RepID=A0AAV7SKU0_PLEWA|nr:hypothetical protein NDU88_005147 [Pleurodeles waltl]